MTRLKVLVACERSQVVQHAFAKLGHFACSMDIEPAYGPDKDHHILADAYTFPLRGWDLIIAHPPCTTLCRAAYGCLGKPGHELNDVLRAIRLWARFLWQAPCPVAVENPVGLLNNILPPSQIINPYDFGDPYYKETCLWLRGLPPLFRTFPCKPIGHWVKQRGKSDIHAEKVLGVPRSLRSQARSQTFPGIANAMAVQWSHYLAERAQDCGTPANCAASSACENSPDLSSDFHFFTESQIGGVKCGT